MKFLISIVLISLFYIGQSQENTLLKGIYLGHLEFFNNSPKGTDQFYIEKSSREGTAWEGSESITIRLNESDRKITNVWGFSFGESAYIQYQNDFFPIFSAEDSILFYSYGTVSKEDWYKGDYQNPSDAKRAKANAIDKAKLEKHKYLIDQNSGEITRVPTKLELEELAEKYMEVIIYRISKKEKDSAFVVTVNDGNPTICQINSVHSYLVSPEMGETTICLSDDDHTCIDIPFNQKTPQYVEVSLKENETKAELRLAKQEEGEWNWGQIMNSKRRAEND